MSPAGQATAAIVLIVLIVLAWAAVVVGIMRLEDRRPGVALIALGFAVILGVIWWLVWACTGGVTA